MEGEELWEGCVRKDNADTWPRITSLLFISPAFGSVMLLNGVIKFPRLCTLSISLRLVSRYSYSYSAMKTHDYQ